MNPIEIISKISIPKIINYLNDIVTILLRPRKFFLSLYSKSAEDKFSQIIFYFLIYIVLYTIFEEKESFNNIVKWFIVLLLYNIIFFPVLIISNIVTASIFKISKFKIIDIFIFNLIATIFFELLVDFSDSGFNFTQADEFLFISNLFKVYGFFYLSIISQTVFYSQRKHVITGIFITWILANIVERGLDKVTTDDFGNLFSRGMDDATDEMRSINLMDKHLNGMNNAIIYIYESSKNIKFFEDEKLKKSKKIYYEASINELYNFADKTENYIKSIEKNINELNKEKTKLEFRRNRVAVDDYLAFDHAVIDFYNRKTTGEYLFTRNFIIWSKGDSIRYIPIKVYVSKDIYKRHIKALDSVNQIYKRAFISNLPMILEDMYFLQEDFSSLKYIIN